MSLPPRSQTATTTPTIPSPAATHPTPRSGSGFFITAPGQKTGATNSQAPPANKSSGLAATAASASATATPKPATPPTPNASLNRTTIVLDPARGGADGGSRIADAILEKDVTLALAFRLRSLLDARGFTAVLTREDDAAVEPKNPDTPLSLNDRAGIANHARAAACLLLHATGSGTGVHLYNSELDPVPAEITPLPWLTAQAAWVPQSRRLLRLLGESLNRAAVPLVTSAASVRPLDSLTCPALVVELAPRTDDPSSINDAAYQQRVAEALVGTLVFWQNAAQPPTKLAPPPRPASSATHVAHAPSSTLPAPTPSTARPVTPEVIP